MYIGIRVLVHMQDVLNTTLPLLAVDVTEWVQNTIFTKNYDRISLKSTL